MRGLDEETRREGGGPVKGLTGFFQGDVSPVTRALLVVIAVALVPAIFLPVWKITLHAPQYPQGLDLTIYANRIAGDLGEINLLNHYIGMEEIRPDEFREFIFIPFFLLRFLGFALLAALVARMPIAAIGYLDFSLFGAVMMYDFQTWLTRFGQGLAKGAPLAIEPFSPSFFGSTMVGQFEVTSYPGAGGVIMLAAGMLGPVVLVYELWRRRMELRAE
jgi:copper chaperone NosL